MDSRSAALTSSPYSGVLELLILQPTPFCNLDCDYCYLPERHVAHRMSLHLLEQVAQRVARSGLLGEHLTIVWHGGEPLAVPLDFYRSALDVFSATLPSSCSTSFAFQTNATLITDDWCRYFADRRVSVGVSIDGPAALHDAHRKTRRGTGTLSETLNGMRKLQDHGIDFSVITVLTYDALEFPDELLDFYTEQRITRVGFNIEELEGANLHSSLGVGDSEQRFRRFLKRLIRLSHQRGWPVHFRELEQFLALLIRRETVGANQQTDPMRILTVAWNGTTGTFSPELLGTTASGYPPGFAIGNLDKQDISDMAVAEPFLALAGDVAAGVDRCRSECSYFNYCGGGAPANKVFENGTLASSETMFCRLMRKATIDVVLEDIAYFSNLRGFSVRGRDGCGTSGARTEG